MESVTAGSWVAERPLGEGGMGRVYLARHQRLNTLAALKVLYPSLTHDQSFRDRFLLEAQTQSQLQHPNIARVIDYIEQQDQFYLVVEYLAGGTLADVIDHAGGPIDPGRALTWTKQALYALDYAHQRGVIHRDIKPSNLMFDESGNLKVMDFGIALVMGGRRLTSTGVTMGTPEYMSPEQIARPKDVDHRTDVYSMAIVLYEMLAGRPPFQGDTDFSIRAAQVNNPPPPLRYLNPSIPEALDQAVMRALAKDPNQRYSGCGEFINALERFPSGSFAQPVPPIPPQPPAQPYGATGPPPPMGGQPPAPWPQTPQQPTPWPQAPQATPPAYGSGGYGPGNTVPMNPSPSPQNPQGAPPGYGPGERPNTPAFQPYGAGGQVSPLPPAPGVELIKSMPVALAILLQMVTCGLYQYVWFLTRRRSINSLPSREKLGSGVFIVCIGWWAMFLGGYILAVALSAAASESPHDSDIQSLSEFVSVTVGLLGICGWVILVSLIVQSFKVRRILRDYFNGYLNQNIYWSGPMVFFFGYLYLQYKINRLEYNAGAPIPDYRAPYG